MRHLSIVDTFHIGAGHNRKIARLYPLVLSRRSYVLTLFCANKAAIICCLCFFGVFSDVDGSIELMCAVNSYTQPTSFVPVVLDALLIHP